MAWLVRATWLSVLAFFYAFFTLFFKGREGFKERGACKPRRNSCNLNAWSGREFRGGACTQKKAAWCKKFICMIARTLTGIRDFSREAQREAQRLFRRLSGR